METDALPLIAQYGLLAPLMIVIWSEMRRKDQRIEQLEQDNKELNKTIQEKTLPGLFEVAQAMKEATTITKGMKEHAEIEAEVQRRLRKESHEEEK